MLVHFQIDLTQIRGAQAAEEMNVDDGVWLCSLSLDSEHLMAFSLKKVSPQALQVYLQETIQHLIKEVS